MVTEGGDERRRILVTNCDSDAERRTWNGRRRQRTPGSLCGRSKAITTESLQDEKGSAQSHFRVEVGVVYEPGLEPEIFYATLYGRMEY